jgi:hypothetical protein
MSKLRSFKKVIINALQQAELLFQFFWSALESFDDRQRGRFIKFACNQVNFKLIKS